VTDVTNNELFRVNPSNGDRVVVSGNGTGRTTLGGLTYGIALYPTIPATIPEPSSLVLLALGTAGMFFARGRRAPRRPA
jgi:hypothetical protein